MSENPLILREAGLLPGQRPWASPLRWTLYLVLVYQVVRLVDVALEWLIELQASILNSEASREVFRTLFDPVFVRVRVWGIWGFFLVITLLPVWATTRSWGREKETSCRDQIAVTFITCPQLITAKAAIWLLPYLLLSILVCLRFLATDLAALHLTTPDSLAAVMYRRIPWEAFSATAWLSRSDRFWYTAWLMEDYGMALLLPIGLGALLVGSATRLVLATRRPLLSFTLVSAGVITWLGLIAPPLNRMFAGVVVQFVLQRGESTWEILFLSNSLDALATVLFLVATLWLWWHLPRHVALAYGIHR